MKLPNHTVVGNLLDFGGLGVYPHYLFEKNAAQFIDPVARYFCIGAGYDIGCGLFPMPGAIPIDKRNGQDGTRLPPGEVDYIFSSHCLEHLPDPIGALHHWRSRLKPGGVLLLYLPHPDMVLWRTEYNPGHRNLWYPEEVVAMLVEAGFVRILNGTGHDLEWSFAVVGFKP